MGFLDKAHNQKKLTRSTPQHLKSFNETGLNFKNCMKLYRF